MPTFKQWVDIGRDNMTALNFSFYIGVSLCDVNRIHIESFYELLRNNITPSTNTTLLDSYNSTIDNTEI